MQHAVRRQHARAVERHRLALQVGKPAARRLDSRANLGVWRERLRDDEVARIRDLTADVAPAFGYTSGTGSR